MSAPFGRRGLALLFVIVAALAAGSASFAADQRMPEKHLSIAGLGAGPGHVRSRIVHTKVARRLAAQPGAWGGVYTTKSGAQVTIYSSRYYSVDESVNQAAADFVGSLVHGPEISGVKIYFAPPAEVGILCFTPDAGALAALEQDVLKPWKDDAIKRWSGRFTRRGQAKTFTFKTPLDGVFASQLRGPHGSTLRLSGPAEVKRLSSTLSAGLVCGERTVSARFVAGAPGRFTAAVAIP